MEKKICSCYSSIWNSKRNTKPAAAYIHTHWTAVQVELLSSVKYAKQLLTKFWNNNDKLEMEDGKIQILRITAIKVT